MGKIVIGLDLGIASVGYSVMLVEDNQTSLLERGSHLFPILSDPKTLTKPGGYGAASRGEYRRTRRTIQRRKQRRIDFVRLINDYKVNDVDKRAKYSNIFNFVAKEEKNISYPIYELAVKGLEEELTPKELFKVLYSKLSFRGVSYHFEEENLEQPLSIELLNILKNVGKIRTPNARTNSTNKTLKFSIIRNKKDIEKIIDNCSYLKDTDFKIDYLSIFERVRDYAKGAGSEKSRTDGGIFKKTRDAKGNIVNLSNMWEESIGKCPIYPEEYRSLKCQALPEIANLLSQLNSIKYKINNTIYYLTEKQKKEIIINVIKKFEVPTPNRITKIMDLPKGILFGYPTSKDRTKPNIEKCENLIRLFKNKVLIFKNWEQSLQDIKFTDEIFAKILINFYNKDEIINANKDYQLSIKEVKMEDKDKVINNYEEFCCLNPSSKLGKSEEDTVKLLENFQKNNISGTHKYSLKAIEKYINKNIDTQKTQSIFYLKETKEFKLKEYKFNKWSKYINNRLMDGVEFISPNVKSSMSETCKIFNKILKKYIYNGPQHFLDALVIETTSDSKYALHGLENNREIIKTQEKNLKEKNEIRKTHPYIKDSAIEKIILLRSQDHVDLYDGKPIHEQDVINHPESFEIDHILPISRTQMNDRTNKLLTKSFNNQAKGNKTPYEWLSSNPNFNALKIRWKSIFEKTDPIKLKNLQLENLSADREKKFISRNLVETQYIMKRIKNGFLAWQSFILENHSSKDVRNQINNLEVLTISGSATQRLRKEKYLNIKKSRDISAEHHSIDATICAILGTLPQFRNTMKSFIRDIDNETGEIKWVYNDLKPKDIFSYFVIPQKIWINFSEIIANSPWLLSYKYITKLDKYNTIDEKLEAIKKWHTPKISGEHIYGWVKKENKKLTKKIVKLTDLKDGDFKYLNDIFKKTYEDSSCLNSKNYFEALRKIWEKYYNNDKKNPFLLYMNDYANSDQEFQIASKLNQIKLIDGKLNSNITRMTFIGDQKSIGLDLSGKMAKNAFMSNLTTKCIYVVKDQKGKKSFLKEDWLNKGWKYHLDNNLKIIDIIEIGTIYKIEGDLFNNNLVKVTTFNVSNSCLHLKSIHNNNLNEIAKPYNSFSKLNSKICNTIIIK